MLCTRVVFYANCVWRKNTNRNINVNHFATKRTTQNFAFKRVQDRFGKLIGGSCQQFSRNRNSWVWFELTRMRIRTSIRENFEMPNAYRVSWCRKMDGCVISAARIVRIAILILFTKDRPIAAHTIVPSTIAIPHVPVHLINRFAKAIFMNVISDITASRY